MDDEHVRIINMELLPKEVQEYISSVKIADEPKHHTTVDEFHNKVYKDLNSK